MERKQEYQRARSRILPNGMLQPEAALSTSPVGVPGRGSALPPGCVPFDLQRLHSAKHQLQGICLGNGDRRAPHAHSVKRHAAA